MKYLRLLSRIVLGVVFIFSGFVKAVDPLGSAYKFSDYFTAFRLDFLDFLSLPLAVVLCSFELVLGITLLLGYRRRTIASVLMVFMSFFTFLTLVLAIFDPVSDCGCFGDALILTNWQTFLKNVVLMVFTVVVFLSRKQGQDQGNTLLEWILVGLFFVGASCFSVWNFRHLPLLDFRPYDIGTVIEDEMHVPEGSPVDEYETTLVYRNRNSGEREEFTIGDYPRDSAEWEFVSSESKLVRKGVEPPIHDFAISDDFGNNLVDGILADKGFTLLMVSHDLESADEKALKDAVDWYHLETLADNFTFYAVTSSPSAVVEDVEGRMGLEYPFQTADEIMLKTMVRSNPGFVLIGQGDILGKWGWRDFPDLEEILPGVRGMIENASIPLDEETTLLMDAGVYEDFSFGIIDFQTLLPALVFKPAQRSAEKRAVTGFILVVGLLLFASSLLAPVKTE